MGDLQERQKERIARGVPTGGGDVASELVLVQNELDAASRYVASNPEAMRHLISAVSHLTAAVKELARQHN